MWLINDDDDDDDDDDGQNSFNSFIGRVQLALLIP